MTAGDWGARIGTEVRGKSLAVIGRGRIGTAVMQLAGAFGMQVVCAGRNDDFGIAASDADFISLHLPSNMDTHHFLNRDTLAVLSPHAWIINTARGSVVDENALYDALAGGQIAGAALDVFDREPYQPADPSRDLRRLPNVILTPHIGSNTAEANARMAARALKNVRFGMAKEYAAMDLLNQDVRAMLETGDAGSGGPMR